MQKTYTDGDGDRGPRDSPSEPVIWCKPAERRAPSTPESAAGGRCPHRA